MRKIYVFRALTILHKIHKNKIQNMKVFLGAKDMPEKCVGIDPFDVERNDVVGTEDRVEQMYLVKNLHDENLKLFFFNSLFF